MGGSRLVETALRCYPARWRRRHGDEAAELATLLIRDGTPAYSIAFSYLAGAAGAWLTPRPGRRLSAAAGVLLAVACSLGISVALLASTGPARAASTNREQGNTRCRPGSLETVPGLIPATGHTQLIIREADHGRSCQR